MITRSQDTLQKIAFEQFGDVSKYRDLLDANPDLSVFDELVNGYELEIPDPSELVEKVTTLIESELDLSNIKQPETGNPHQLISWVL